MEDSSIPSTMDEFEGYVSFFFFFVFLVYANFVEWFFFYFQV